jgi:hypothetical protein
MGDGDEKDKNRTLCFAAKAKEHCSLSCFSYLLQSNIAKTRLYSAEHDTRYVQIIANSRIFFFYIF